MTKAAYDKIAEGLNEVVEMVKCWTGCCDLPDGHEGGHVMYVSAEAWDQLQAILAEPPQPNERMRKLMSEAPPWGDA